MPKDKIGRRSVIKTYAPQPGHGFSVKPDRINPRGLNKRQHGLARQDRSVPEPGQFHDRELIHIRSTVFQEGHQKLEVEPNLGAIANALRLTGQASEDLNLTWLSQATRGKESTLSLIHISEPTRPY